MQSEAAPITGGRSAATLRDRVARAEASLRTGQFEASLEYPSGTRSVAVVRFDLGDGQSEPRLHISTSYQSPSGTQADERIVIGDRAWQRQPDGRWIAISGQAGLLEQAHAYLPRIASIPAAAVLAGTDDGTTTMLRWYDAARDAEITLEAERATGVPRRLRQVVRTTGAVLTVTYSAWNVPVEIDPPPELP